MSRISLTDRPWLPFRGALSIGPLATPSVDEVRACLRLVAESFPDNPLVCRIDLNALQWRPVPVDELDDHLRAVVVGGGDVDAGSLETQLPLWLDDYSQTLPLKILVGRRAFTMMTSHALGDGRADFALLERLLRCGSDPRAILAMAGPTSDRSTLRALTDFYGRRPGRMIDTWRSARPVPAPTPLTRRGPPAPPSRPLFVYSRLDRVTWSAIRAYRTERFPDASVAAVLFSLTCEAFASSGLEVDDAGFYLLVDNRRYLRGAAPLSGNMAKSVYVRPDDLRDPNAIHRIIRETVTSGRTLASAAHSAVSFEWHRRSEERTGQSSGWAPSGEVVLSLTYLSQTESFESLPWLGGDGERWLAGCGTTGSPTGITVFYADVHGELHLSVSFVPDRVDEAGVRRALSLLQAGPLAGI